MTALPYAPRVADAALTRLLASHPAVLVEGAKAVGKTATASRHVTHTFYLDSMNTRRLLEADPNRLGKLPYPALVDEWQRMPETLDIIRRAVDAGAPPGRFVLTGSAGSAVTTHSGAGRIVSLHMRPMSLAERWDTTDRISLASLMSGRAETDGDCSFELDDYVEAIVGSGFPGIYVLPADDRRGRLDAYLNALFTRELPLEGLRVRQPQAMRRWLAAYAAATSTTAAFERVRDAASPNEADKPTRITADRYRSLLEYLYILDPLPAWSPTLNPFSRLATASKHHLVDPALAARLTGRTAGRLLSDGLMLGQLFESLATQSVRVYAQAAGASPFHLRSFGGDREIDLVVESDEGLVAFEVKLGAEPDDRDARHLLWLRHEMPDEVRDLVILTAGKHAYRRKDGVAVIPLGLLGP